MKKRGIAEIEEKPGEILFLSAADTEKSLSVKTALRTVEDTFRWIGEGLIQQAHCDACQGMLNTISDPEDYAYMLPHPCWNKAIGVAGMKWSGASKSNPRKGLRASTGLLILNNPETCHPFAILDSGTITSIRTGAHAAIGAKYLARKDSNSVAMIGCGDQARSHLLALNEIFDLRSVNIYDINEKSMEKYREQMSTMIPKLKINMKGSPKETVANVDIVCMVTRAFKPIVFDKMIGPGTYVAATNQFFDLDPKLSKTADKWVLGDYGADLPWVLFATFGSPSPFDREDVYADMSEIVIGKMPGRETDKERIVMTHTGMGAFDIPAGYAAYRIAKQMGLGVKIRLF